MLDDHEDAPNKNTYNGLELQKSITPRVEELLPYNKIKCSESGCDAIFLNMGNYELHLKRHHKVERSRLDSKCSYHCPVIECKYNVDNGEKSFKDMKNLRQHYQKVHGRLYGCNNCDRSFPTPNQLQQHQLNACGKKFGCSTCNWSYDSLEALMTHAKRKGHTFPSELRTGASKRKAASDTGKTHKRALSAATATKNSTPRDMPKLVPIVQNLLPIVRRPKTFLEKETQTKSLVTCTVATSTINALCHSPPKQTSSIEVQTEQALAEDEEAVRPKSTSAALKETESAMIASHTDHERNDTRSPWRHIETQTDEFLAAYKNDLHELATVAMTLASTTSSSAKKIDSECNTPIITTATANTNTYIDNILEQTSSHMYTQTCDDYFLSELCLNDIQTQTNWSSLEDLTTVDKDAESSSFMPSSSSTAHCALDELLVSTETQTSFTQYLLDNCSEPTKQCNDGSCTTSFGQLYTTQHTQTCDFDALEDLFGKRI